MNKNLNCSTEILMESVAQLKDINTQKKGLLYGVPISIKDNVAYKVNIREHRIYDYTGEER